MIHKKVKFKGEVYWFHSDYEGDNPVLSPLDHFDVNGELLTNPFRAVSFAVIEGDEIVRYQEVIGKVSELEDVE